MQFSQQVEEVVTLPGRLILSNHAATVIAVSCFVVWGILALVGSNPSDANNSKEKLQMVALIVGLVAAVVQIIVSTNAI